MVSEVEKFWNDFIVGDKEPELTNVNDVVLKYPKHFEGKSKDATFDILASHSRLKEVKKQLSELEKQKEEYEGYIKLFMQDAEILKSENEVLATWKANVKGSRILKLK